MQTQSFRVLSTVVLRLSLTHTFFAIRPSLFLTCCQQLRHVSKREKFRNFLLDRILQPVPEKTGLEMVFEIGVEILDGHHKSLFKHVI
mmetsp:Transcript_33235/g.53525  ORF Transcript_33235/g.53525 Transcript_33235/m.53525 type:complete len:88 (-) Transcript_33235:1745-2008(-)